MPSLIQKPNVIVDCTLDCEDHKPESDRIVWKAKVLSSGDRADYDNQLADALGLSGDAKRDALNKVIRAVATDWGNVVDSDGKPAAFTDENLNLLSSEMKTIIALQLPSAAGWGDMRKKKSASQ